MKNRNSIRTTVLLMILIAIGVIATAKQITQEKPVRNLNPLFAKVDSGLLFYGCMAGVSEKEMIKQELITIEGAGHLCKAKSSKWSESMPYTCHPVTKLPSGVTPCFICCMVRATTSRAGFSLGRLCTLPIKPSAKGKPLR